VIFFLCYEIFKREFSSILYTSVWLQYSARLGYILDQLVEELLYKPQGYVFGFWWGHCYFTLTILLASLWLWSRLNL